MVTTAADPIAQISDPEEEKPGWIGLWVRRDPVRAAAALLIVIQVLWRTQVSAGGFMAHDDFYLAIKAKEFGLDVDNLFTHFNNHMMPASMAFIYYVTEWVGYEYWPYLAAMIVCQAVLSISFYRLLRLMIPAKWGLLIPLCIFLFSPLNLETTSWWVFGAYILPMQMAVVWAMGSQVKFARTRRPRHLVSLLAALLFGLAFTEKTLLMVPLLFVFTACFLVKGSPGRSLLRAQVRYWQTWVVLLVPTAAYLVLYLHYAAQTSMRAPESVNQLTTFFKQFFGFTLIPGLLGGPWTWLNGSVVPLSTPTPVLQTISWSIAIGFVIYTVWRRPAAGRAWVLFLAYALMASGLVAASRLGFALSWFAGMVTRYTSDVVIVAALCIGVALFGLRDFPDRKEPRKITWLETTAPGRLVAGALGAVLLVLVTFGTIMTTSSYEQAWRSQPGRDFFHTAQAELAKAPAGTVFLDLPVGEHVMAGYYHPYNMQSHFFRVLGDKGPVFVKGAESPVVFAGTGQIKPPFVKPLRETLPGPVADCGHEVLGGAPKTLPLNGPMFEWPYALRISYTSDREMPVTVRFGKATIEFTARPGFHHYFVYAEGGGDALAVQASVASARLCVHQIVVGELMPWLL